MPARLLRGRRLPLVLSVAVLAPVAALATASAAPAGAACATKTTKSFTGFVYGQDGRDVNASVGFDVLDANGRPINVDPTRSDYGCKKTGAYSTQQTYLNHFVSYEGQPAGSPMHDAQGRPQGRTTRAVKLANLPSNARTIWIEVYSRGYKGSPCKDSAGNWCFNPPDVRKYGYASKIKVPVGTQNLHVKLPTTCAYKGTAGSIAGKATNAAGQPVTLKQVYAWTQHAYNTAPGIHGWGSFKPTTSAYKVSSLAAGQKYVVWLYRPDGTKIVKRDVMVNACKTTPLNVRV